MSLIIYNLKFKVDIAIKLECGGTESWPKGVTLAVSSHGNLNGGHSTKCGATECKPKPVALAVGAIESWSKGIAQFLGATYLFDTASLDGWIHIYECYYLPFG